MKTNILFFSVCLRMLKFTKIMLVLPGLLFLSCETIEIEEPNFQLTSKTVFSEDATAESAMVGIYSNMLGTAGFMSGGRQSIVSLTGLSADEFLNFSFTADQAQFFNNALQSDNSILVSNLWDEAYFYIYQSNALLEGLAESEGLTPEVKERLQGEALFIRAFCYFYLVNLFGEVPLVLSTDYRSNILLERSSVEQVYQIIHSDLSEAVEWLPDDFGFSGGERVRPTSWAARAMLARVELYRSNWEEAEKLATEVIEHTQLFDLSDDLNEVFFANSKEAIWQLKPNIPNFNTNEAATFYLNFPPFHVSLQENLVEGFASGGEREEAWIDSLVTAAQTYYFPTKYKVNYDPVLSEYSMVLRLAEQYLIRAEARAQQGKIQLALHDLNVIRRRAGLDPYEDGQQEQILEHIYQERRLELFSEGHRWLDLKRTGRAGEVLGSYKQEWQSTDVLYPIPQRELERAPNLGQNPGYNI